MAHRPALWHTVYTKCIRMLHMKECGLHVRVEENLRRRFVEACQQSDQTASQVLRAFMRRYVEDWDIARQQDLFTTTEIRSSGSRDHA